MLASSLIAGGMNWKQAILTILLGNLIVLIPMLLNAHAGAKYGIPFPVFVRATFGPAERNLPAMLRAIVACGWFGIQSWIGGQAIAAMLERALARNDPMPVGPLDLLPRLLAAQHGRRLARCRIHPLPPELLRALHARDVRSSLLFWMLHKAGGFGPMLSAPSQFTTTGSFLALLLPVTHRDGRLLGHALAQHS